MKWIRFWIVTIIVSFCGMLFALGCGENTSNNRSQTKQKVVRVASTQRTADKQIEFEEWLLKNTAVIEVHFESNWQIWVRLSPEKYTNKANVTRIAEQIAAWYAQRMNKTRAICTVWDYSNRYVYAKGKIGF